MDITIIVNKNEEEEGLAFNSLYELNQYLQREVNSLGENDSPVTFKVTVHPSMITIMPYEVFDDGDLLI